MFVERLDISIGRQFSRMGSLSCSLICSAPPVIISYLTFELVSIGLSPRDHYTSHFLKIEVLAIRIMGINHNVSKEYLHRYEWQVDFPWNARKMNDGERTIVAIELAEGKQLMYRMA